MKLLQMTLTPEYVTSQYGDGSDFEASEERFEIRVRQSGIDDIQRLGAVQKVALQHLQALLDEEIERWHIRSGQGR